MKMDDGTRALLLQGKSNKKRSAKAPAESQIAQFIEEHGENAVHVLGEASPVYALHVAMEGYFEVTFQNAVAQNRHVILEGRFRDQVGCYLYFPTKQELFFFVEGRMETVKEAATYFEVVLPAYWQDRVSVIHCENEQYEVFADEILGKMKENFGENVRYKFAISGGNFRGQLGTIILVEEEDKSGILGTGKKQYFFLPETSIHCVKEVEKLLRKVV